MPYVCTVCGQHQQGQSEDNICPQHPRVPKREEPDTSRHARPLPSERDVIVAWLRSEPMPGAETHQQALADRIEQGEHMRAWLAGGHFR